MPSGDTNTRTHSGPNVRWPKEKKKGGGGGGGGREGGQTAKSLSSPTNPPPSPSTNCPLSTEPSEDVRVQRPNHWGWRDMLTSVLILIVLTTIFKL